MKDNYRNLLDQLRKKDEQILFLEKVSRKWKQIKFKFSTFANLQDLKTVKDENKKLLEENSALLRAIRKIS